MSLREDLDLAVGHALACRAAPSPGRRRSSGRWSRRGRRPCVTTQRCRGAPAEPRLGQPVLDRRQSSRRRVADLRDRGRRASRTIRYGEADSVITLYTLARGPGAGDREGRPAGRVAPRRARCSRGWGAGRCWRRGRATSTRSAAPRRWRPTPACGSIGYRLRAAEVAAGERDAGDGGAGGERGGLPPALAGRSACCARAPARPGAAAPGPGRARHPVQAPRGRRPAAAPRPPAPAAGEGAR